MIKEHIHDLAFLDGGEGIYCTDVDCDYKLTGDNLLSVLKSMCLPDEAILAQFTDEQIRDEAFRRRYTFEVPQE